MKVLVFVTEPANHQLAISHLIHHDLTVVYTEKDAVRLAKSGQYDLFVRDLFFMDTDKNVAYPVGLNLTFAGAKESILKGGYIFTNKDVSSALKADKYHRDYNSPGMVKANPLHGTILQLKEMSENDTQRWMETWEGFSAFERNEDLGQ